jgi:nitrate reductase gamma subunit
MVVFWRGWGIAVLFSVLFWYVAALAAAVAFMPHEPDRAKSAMMMQAGVAGIFVLSALTVLTLARMRANRPIGTDTFLFMRMDVWTYILLVVAALIGVATVLGYPLFTG